MIKQLSAGLLGLALLSGSATAESAIERLAPANTVLVAGATKAGLTMERFKRTAMWQLFQSEEMQKLMAPDGGPTLHEMLEDMYEELGVEEGSLVAPRGEVGLVIFAANDPETGLRQPAFMACADYGDDADKTQSLIMAALQKGEDDDMLEWEEDEFDGWRVVSVDLSAMHAAAAMGEDEFGAGGGPAFMPGPDDVMRNFSKLHFSRRGELFVFSSGLRELTSGLNRLETDDAEGLAQRDDYRQLQRMLGPSDGSVIILTRDLMGLVGSFDQMGMMMMLQPMIRSAFGEIAGYGFGVRLDGAEAMSEATMAITMPRGKSGLPALLDLEEPRGGLPPFVGPDTISYTRLNFKFNELKDFVTDFVRANPFLQMQLGEAMPMIESVAERLGTTLGPEIHTMEMLRRPITLETIQSLTAIRCARPQEFEELFGELQGQIPMEPRDFRGHRIYVMDMGGGMMPGMPAGGAGEMALGIGGGYVFMGDPAAVENALRTIGEANLPSLAEEPAYMRAMASLPGGPAVSWGFSSTVDVMESRQTLERLMQEEMVEKMVREFPDFADEIKADFAAQPSPDIDFTLLRRFLGPSAWSIRSTEDGFLGRFYMLDAGGAERVRHGED